MRVHVPFPLQDLRQIKTDPGKFADDPEKYLEVFLMLIQSFELTWRDVIPLLNQTLTEGEKGRVIKNAQEWGDEYGKR